MPATDSTISFGYCHCGCGKLTPLWTDNSYTRGRAKGLPMKFLPRHNFLVGGKSKLDWLIEAIATHTSDECLLWRFYVDDEGYGALSFKGQRVLAHRLAFFLTYCHWPFPEGCHTCDTPTCFNPRHIFEGTHEENHLDSSVKLRRRKKLTPEIVAEIRREYAPYKRGVSGLELAKKYGVTRSCIHAITTRQTWKLIG